MPIKNSKKAYEECLNEIGCSFENCEYLCNPSRGKYLKVQSLKTSLYENHYGTILRKYDPVAFETSYQEFVKSNFK